MAQSPATTWAAHLDTLRAWMPDSEWQAVKQCCRGEEQEWFIAKVAEMSERTRAMPSTYQQDGLGDAAIAHLHYFKGGIDAYITERDSESEQLQAFGMVDLGYGAELGYISIPELVATGVELDLHFDPRPLSEIRR